MKEGMGGGEEFLKKKYDLHKSGEVEQAAERALKRTGEEVPQDPSSRIRNYLDRFNEILKREDLHERERGIDALKEVLHRRYVIKPSDVPESVFLLEQRLARELGHGDVEITQEFKDRKTQEIVQNQAGSLDKWVDYLASEDAQYPDWAKYWAMRSILEMGKIRKETDETGKETLSFQKRTKDTAAAFPPMNPRAFAMAVEAIQAVRDEAAKPKAERQPLKNLSIKLDDQAFRSLAATENFSKMYARFLIEMPEYSTEGLQEIRGNWVKYDQGSDAAPLVDSLEGHPLEWCTAAYDTAKTQLQGGDFYVYYSVDQNGEAKIPRAAIRMEEDRIAEVRGIAGGQNLDPYIAPVVQKKMKEFPDGEAYEKKAADMKRLTDIEGKTEKGTTLTKAELKFLYEINGKIEGFGYQRDPRIKELRDKRNPKEDAPIVFDCAPNQIAWSQKEISKNTKAYIGPLFPGVFDLEHLEHLYTSFPEGRIEERTLEIGGITPKEYEKELQKDGHQISNWGKDILAKTESSKEQREISLVRLTVADLGFKTATRYDEIQKRAKELGLELAPAEVGPALRLAMKDQPMGDWVLVGMEALTDRYRNPYVFGVARDEGGSWLRASSGDPGPQWFPAYSFVFCRRKP